MVIVKFKTKIWFTYLPNWIVRIFEFLFRGCPFHKCNFKIWSCEQFLNIVKWQYNLSYGQIWNQHGFPMPKQEDTCRHDAKNQTNMKKTIWESHVKECRMIIQIITWRMPLWRMQSLGYRSMNALSKNSKPMKWKKLLQTYARRIKSNKKLVFHNFIISDFLFVPHINKILTNTTDFPGVNSP